jgi:hypothetical protein
MNNLVYRLGYPYQTEYHFSRKGRLYGDLI